MTENSVKEAETLLPVEYKAFLKEIKGKILFLPSKSSACGQSGTNCSLLGNRLKNCIKTKGCRLGSKDD